jgi:hypothetical protein
MKGVMPRGWSSALCAPLETSRSWWWRPQRVSARLCGGNMPGAELEEATSKLEEGVRSKRGLSGTHALLAQALGDEEGEL